MLGAVPNCRNIGHISRYTERPKREKRGNYSKIARAQQIVWSQPFAPLPLQEFCLGFVGRQLEGGRERLNSCVSGENGDGMAALAVRRHGWLFARFTGKMDGVPVNDLELAI
jgi:hypothetical protein